MKACPKCGSKEHGGFLPPDFESVHCSKCGKCYEPGNGPMPSSKKAWVPRALPDKDDLVDPKQLVTDKTEDAFLMAPFQQDDTLQSEKDLFPQWEDIFASRKARIAAAIMTAADQDRVKEIAERWYRPDGSPKTRAMTQVLIATAMNEYGISLRQAAKDVEKAILYYKDEHVCGGRKAY